MLLVEPVVIRPLLAEWNAEKTAIAAELDRVEAARSRPARTKRLNEAERRYRAFLNRLRGFTVLDPACGSGNFLYLALQALKDLEHRVQLEAEALGFQRAFPDIGPANVKGIEINPYAAELARVSVWIGEIQWMRRNGFGEARDPILKPLDTIECRDAILAPANLEPEWPAADVVIGRVPTRSVRKYTARAQLKPSGAPEPASGRGETGGGGRPARFCQEQTLVLAEQFSSMEHDAFRVPYLSDKIPEAAFHRQAVKTVAYLRVSTAQQDVRSQRLAILEYARKHDFRIDDFIEADASGQASEKRRRLDELTSILQRGDRLVVSELSRLGRSLGQIVAILDAFAKAGVAFVALKENICVEGRRDIQTKVMTMLFALFAEVERDLISERTREGLARARSSGRKLGRPKGSLGVSRLDGKEDEIRGFLELGVSKTAIAKITGVSRTALYSFMSTRGLRPSP